ncbi:hypothetical protein [Streptomyces sp. NRRL S-118]|uniref:hypothetical protein n=1 Tax=Streptomyces sp. NRRL S-118 TaxID=1463881 RepID=UPI0004CB74CC|nr:hypothetical protein [Streptomyces sp. NRRL S-118]
MYVTDLRRWAAAAAAFAMTVTGLTAASGSAHATPEAPPEACPRLTVTDGWYGRDRDRLQRMIDNHGRCGSRVRADGRKPVAVFDRDSTVIRNGAGDATLLRLLSDSPLRPPGGGDRPTTGGHLTDAAAASLAAACPTTG